MTGFWLVAFVMLWILVLILAALVTGILLRIETILKRTEARLSVAGESHGAGLASGETVPSFKTRTSGGELVTSDVLLFGAPSLFLFVGTDCPPCQRLVSDLESDGWNLATRLLLVTSGEEGTQEWLQNIPPGVPVIFDAEREVNRAFATDITPHAFLIEAGKVIAKSIPGSLAALHGWAVSHSADGEVVNSEVTAVMP